jgi:hypothetical protein
MSPRPARTCSAAAFLAGVLLVPAAVAQDQTWYELGGSFVDAGDRWGRTVALLPDLDSDGHAEMLIGTVHDTSFGSAYLIGGTAPHLLKKQHHGAQADSDFGQVVAYAGLVNADAVGDYLVSAPREDVTVGFQLVTDKGVVRLFSGASGSIIRTFEGTLANDRFGEALAANADVTGDGRPDILIGAPHGRNQAGMPEAGYAELYNGVTGALIHRVNGFEPGDLTGFSVALVGDLTGDGRSEYAVGSPGYDTFGFPPAPDAGRVTVYNGLTHVVVYQRFGVIEGDELGWSICAAGDTDGDNIREILYGTPKWGNLNESGAAWLYEGPEGAFVRGYSGQGGFGDEFGYWACKAGDIDKDGHEELAIGATQAGENGGGYARIFDGETGDLVKTLSWPIGSGAGYAFDGGRDVNADGWPDLLMGLPNSDAIASNAGGAECKGLLHYQPDLGQQGPHVAEFSIYGGTLASGSSADFSLVNGPVNGSGFLLLSPSVGVSFFKGGTLLPKLAGSFLVTFPVLPGGELHFPIPGGNGPLDLYAQFILSGYTSGEPVGISNALLIQLEP